jgi:hypothetical protein
VSHPATAPTGHAAIAANEPLVTSMLSIAVIALTAALLHRLAVPSEVTGSLAMASGALVPAIVIRVRERAKSKAKRVSELVSGTFERPPVLILIIAAGLLALIEWASYVLFFVVAGLASLAAEDEGLLTADAAASVLESEMVTGGIALLGLLLVMAAAVPVGTYVAHRVTHRPLLWAFGAVLLAQAVLLTIDVSISLSTGEPVNYLAYAVFVAAVSITGWLGVRRGRRNRALFHATRLFRRLSETDRSAVLQIMDESHVAERLDT